jgi:methanesulfonate monooxygenase small subunit
VSTRTLVEDLVYRCCLLLDDKDFDGFLGLCDPEFRYTVRTYSPEIRQEMVWLDHDLAGIALLFRNLPRHNSDHALLSRHVTVYTVDAREGSSRAEAVSGLQVFRTTLDGGSTSLFAVGKLYDTVKVERDQARLLRRIVKLDTRMLGIGSHIPF